MRRPAALPLLLAVAALTLSACQIEPQRQASIAAAPARPTGIDGTWASTSGPVAYTATFQGGRFTSRERATGATLAEGNYTRTGPAQVSIIYRSLARDQQLSVNCNQMAADRLACVDANGTRFEFNRA